MRSPGSPRPLVAALALTAFAPAGLAREGDHRESFALAPLSATALYRIDATELEMRGEADGEKHHTGVLTFARKATPSYYWGVRLRPRDFEAEYAYKILDELVTGLSVGYQTVHPGFLIKTERYEMGVSRRFTWTADARAAARTHATVIHASYFVDPASTVSLVAVTARETAVTIALQMAAGAFVHEAAFTDSGSTRSGEVGTCYRLGAGFQAGAGVRFDHEAAVLAQLDKTFL